MMRDPELDKAIADLRPVYAQFRRAKAQMKLDDVRSNLNNRGAVEAVIRDAREHIAVRASHIGIKNPDGLTVILSTFARLKVRLKRWPSAKQVTVLLCSERSASSLAVVKAQAVLVDAEAKLAAAIKADAAVEAACIAFTGYPS